MSKKAVIVGMARTPIGSFLGSLSELSAPRLGAIAIRESLKRSGVSEKDVDEVIMGHVLTAGVGQAPARQAALFAGIPNKVPALTVNKVCGSGLKAVMLARQSILLDEARIVVAGGMESMSQAPYLLPSARAGMRMGNQSAVDGMILDGLWDPYQNAHMGNLGELCSSQFEFSRQQQDAYAVSSYEKALRAQKEDWFADEIVPVTIEGKKGSVQINKDEEPSRFLPEKIPTLKPAFSKEGAITAANASKINDGAAALVLMSEEEAHKRDLTPTASIVEVSTFAHDPDWFTTAPVFAIKKALDKASLKVSDIGLFEINEAFACVSMVAIRELGISPESVNVFGGAIALGHPIGCSGARILVTLLSAMKQRQVRYGCASLCIGGGEAVAVIVERKTA